MKQKISKSWNNPSENVKRNLLKPKTCVLCVSFSKSPCQMTMIDGKKLKKCFWIEAFHFESDHVTQSFKANIWKRNFFEKEWNENYGAQNGKGFENLLFLFLYWNGMHFASSLSLSLTFSLVLYSSLTFFLSSSLSHTLSLT